MAARASIPVASIVMILVTIALFFLPIVNGVVGGAAGGWLAGSVRRGLGAALLPAVLVGAALWVLLALMDLPVVGAIAGMGAGALVVLADVGLLLGAAVGGALASPRRAAA